ncbi:hypothetical protein ABGB12_32400 [Actinocorallia sp. B10E7]|uniref:hypothetical protein n=1 Tax=Actinocorallia sp. B10E7 TaxID=3153558 RepID=UPI00325D4382
MSAESITAVCATVIAVLSLMISLQESHAVRQHNRQSIRPALQLSHIRRRGGITGIGLTNCGIGPAVITQTILKLDGVLLGAWDESTVNTFRERLRPVPGARTFLPGHTLAVGYNELLLYLNEFDVEQHMDFWNLIRHQLELEIHYESLYGGENFVAFLPKGPGRELSTEALGPR